MNQLNSILLGIENSTADWKSALDSAYYSKCKFIIIGPQLVNVGDKCLHTSFPNKTRLISTWICPHCCYTLFSISTYVYFWADLNKIFNKRYWLSRWLRNRLIKIFGHDNKNMRANLLGLASTTNWLLLIEKVFFNFQTVILVNKWRKSHVVVALN